MCENKYGMTTNYSEGNFAPLAISSKNARNFFWNQNTKFPICDICKLILFCISAGTTNISKVIKEKGEYKEKRILNFINYDTTVATLLKTNNNFYNRSKFESNKENPYAQLILNIVEQDKKISEWQLQNIFVVEFEAEYGSFSRIEYFNIRRHVACFFKNYANYTLSKINNYRYKLQIIEYILKNKDIKNIINERLKDELSEETPNVYNSVLAIQTRLILNLLKKEKIRMKEIEKNNNKLYVLYNLGIEIHEKLKNNEEVNKLNGYTRKMLNSIRAGNENEFMYLFTKIHISIGKDVSPIFLEIMQDKGLDFETIGYSFLTGLISNRYNKEKLEQSPTVVD